MLFILILKNIYILLRNYIFLINIIKKKDIFYLFFFILIHTFVLPNTAFCETESTPDEDEKPVNLISDDMIFWTRVVMFIAASYLGWFLLNYFLGPDFDDMSDYSSDNEIPEIKIPPKPYTQGPGYHFFVRDMGIRYEDELDKVCPKLTPENYKKVQKLIEELNNLKK